MRTNQPYSLRQANPIHDGIVVVAVAGLLAVTLPFTVHASTMPNNTGSLDSVEHYIAGGVTSIPVRTNNKLQIKTKMPPHAVSSPPLLPQGYLIHSARGHITMLPDRLTPRLVFFHPHKGWPHSIRLLPNLTLESLMSLRQSHSPLLRVSGLITAYQGKNYMLLNADVQLARITSKPGTTTQSKPLIKSKTMTAPLSRSHPPNPKNLISSLLIHHISPAVGLSSTLKTSPLHPTRLVLGTYHTVPSTCIPEGTYLWNQQGRLMRDPVTHQWLFVFATDGRGFGQPPMILLPCRVLAVMKAQTGGRSGQKPFRISGMVTQYAGHNYLLPTFAQRFFMLDRF